MQLSVVIVNYNVRHFLEQCLNAVYKAGLSLETEILVVDNNSVDGSCQMVKEKFPFVHLIENHENRGFSKANNQAIRIAKGKYILLLNPDTVVEESTFEKCFSFMEEHPEAGGLGVKMIDGKGKFLPESKRALPNPSVAFWKIFGFSALFPHSRTFAKYHLGYLDSSQTHAVEILSGAFMFLRKEALDKTGLLDENFFMYGEDIDLSWRLILAGYTNYYFPGTTIIHYKGESTKKGSLNYVFTFYNAMIIFAHKHFSTRNARAFSLLIHLAIYVRASLSVIRRAVLRTAHPLLDAFAIYAGYLIIKPYWESYKFHDTTMYPPEYLFVVVPAYILIWIISIFFSGGYDKPVKLLNLIKGILIGSFTILVIYALLPSSLRFSRALILLGSVWTLVLLPSLRFILALTRHPQFLLDMKRKKRIVIVGKEQEAARVTGLLQATGLRSEMVGLVHPDGSGVGNYLGNLNQLHEIVQVNKIDEVIFCAHDLSSRDIIWNMLHLTDRKVDFKIAPEESMSVIGSSSINTAGELYIVESNMIARADSRRNKRLLDLLISTTLLLISPVILFAMHRPGRFLRNIFAVFAGNFTWVGYTPGGALEGLPLLRKGVLSPVDGMEQSRFSIEQIERINLLYARDYRMINDLLLIFRNLRKLDR
jgi:GT2 family glycosyltransferase